MLEIFPGRHVIDLRFSPPWYVDLAMPLIRSSEYHEVFDPNMNISQSMVVRQLAVLTAICVKPTAEKRPDMAYVVERSVKEAFRSRVAEGVSTRVEALAAGDANSMWNTLASTIKDAAKDTLRVAIGSSKTHTARRESWWLCEEVQAIVTVKQTRFRELLSCREGNEEERLRAQARYKEAKRQTKKVVALAKEKAYEDLYKKLDSKEGANDIFRIAKARERRRRDLGDICFIKDEEGRTITDEEEIKKRWG
ncbi:hypothetical protein Tco_0612700 [Tanacetum coccineum]